MTTPTGTRNLVGVAVSTTGYIAKYIWTTNTSTTVLANTTNKMTVRFAHTGVTYRMTAVTDAGRECSATVGAGV